MRSRGELARVRGYLVAQLIVFGLPVHGIDRNQECENAGPLDVTQELKSEALPFMRAFDDSGNVRNYESAMIGELHYAEVWRERRERVIRDFGSSRGDD